LVGLAALSMWATQVVADDTYVTVAPDGTLTLKDAAAASAPRLAVGQSDETALGLTLRVPGFTVNVGNTKRGEFLRVGWPGAAVAGEIGAPALPVVRRLIIAPPGARVVVEAQPGEPTVVDVRVIGRHPRGVTLQVMPVQAPVPKIPGAWEQAPFDFDESAYRVDRDQPDERAVVQELGTVRGQRLLLLEVRPLAYNPVAQRLTWWSRIEVRVRFEDGRAYDTPLRPLPGLRHTVLNPELLPGEGIAGKLNREPLYLIVVPDVFVPAIWEFEVAKRTQGYRVNRYEVPAGTRKQQIWDYLHSLYQNPETAPDYILLVGDTDTISHWRGLGKDSPPTDLPYACLDSPKDWLPDVALGRFPARSEEQLGILVDKTLSFEEGRLADPNYKSRAAFLASKSAYTISEGTHNYCIKTHMEPNGYVCDRLYSHTNKATRQQVSDALDNGRLLCIYSGHGNKYAWTDGPPFKPRHIHHLTNQYIYPWVCSFACLTGRYSSPECFMETWVLTRDRGSVASWGSSVTSYWTEDDVLQRRLFDILYHDYVRQLGPLFNLTKMVYAAQMGAGPVTRRYFEMYNLMGDPSLPIPDAKETLRVTPGDGLVAAGPQGGPFDPPSKNYFLRNLTDCVIDYEVTHDEQVDWVTLSGPLRGSLQPGEVTEVSARINDRAATLPRGPHHDLLTFTNLTNHVGDTERCVRLEVDRSVFEATDVPQKIVDLKTIKSLLRVDEHFCIADLNVGVHISHQSFYDLTINLTSPLGTTVTLHNRRGAGIGGGELLRVWDDQNIAPDGPGRLSDFAYESPRGTWILTITDHWRHDEGILHGWNLRALPTVDPCPPLAFDDHVWTLPSTPVDITLQGRTINSDPLDFVIISLPAHGSLRDAGNGEIKSVPHTLKNHGRMVRYIPEQGRLGEDAFQFKTYDGLESAAATLAVSVSRTHLIYAFPLDKNPRWSRKGKWAFGTPTGRGSYGRDPVAGHTGSKVYGYNLDGDYKNRMSGRDLTSKAIGCTNLTDVELRFWHWLAVESAEYDRASVQVSSDGQEWTSFWEHSGQSRSDADWSQVVLDISSVADSQPTVYLRWRMGPTDRSVTYPGWNIDDVEIWAVDSR